MACKTIMMVDDSRLARTLLRTLLVETLPGCEIVEAESGEQALEILKDRTPDLILVDFSMPGINGLDLCLQLRQRWPELPIHLVTANIQDKVRDRAVAHAIGFINKPVSKEALLAILPGGGHP